jgi:hypothetical protein
MGSKGYVSGWFEHAIVAPGKLRLFCFLVAFIVAFVFIRFSVRMIRAQVKWWPGNVTPGGTHIHHVVFGLVFMCVGGVSGLTVQNPRSAWAAASAALLGAGMALVLDEFALVLHLEDVYWGEQGRLSVQVVFIAIAATGLALLGLSPFGRARSGSACSASTSPCSLWSARSGWPGPDRGGRAPATRPGARSWPRRPHGNGATRIRPPPHWPGCRTWWPASPITTASSGDGLAATR